MQGVGAYASNNLAELVDSPTQIAVIDSAAAINWPTAGNFTKYLEEVGFRQLGQEPTPFNNHFGGTIWQVLERDTVKKQAFDRMFSMLAQHGHRRTWDIYPIASALESSAAHVLMVDVGGGRGHDLIAAIRKQPEPTNGRFVLQDLPRALDGIEADTLPKNVETQAYDFFFGPQPVKGAAIYFMHDIMHNHNDTNATIILSRTSEAMSNTSKLLIADWVVRDQNAQKLACYADWMMLMVTSGIERSLLHWTALLDGAGLKIVKVWSSREEAQSVIEAMLK